MYFLLTVSWVTKWKTLVSKKQFNMNASVRTSDLYIIAFLVSFNLSINTGYNVFQLMLQARYWYNTRDYVVSHRRPVTSEQVVAILAHVAK